MLVSNERYIEQGRHPGVSSCARGALAAAILAAAGAVGVIGIGNAQAYTYTTVSWAGATSNDWNVATNWNPNTAVPNADTYEANINNISSSTPDILSGETITVGNVSLGDTTGAAAALTIDGTLDISQSGTAGANGMYIGANTVPSTVTTDATKTVTLDSGGSLTFDTHSELRLGFRDWGELIQIGGTFTSNDHVEMGGAGAQPTVGGIAGFPGFGAVYDMQAGSATFDGSGLDMGLTMNTEFAQTGGTVTVGGSNALDLGDNSAYNTGAGDVAEYAISAGTLNVTATNGIRDINGNNGTRLVSGTFDVEGSNATITTTEFSLEHSGSVLKIGLDANGSSLIQDSGNLTLGHAPSGSYTYGPLTLDVNALAGFTGAGNVAGKSGWYRLASVGGTLTDTNVILSSDTGVVYSLVNDPGFLTIDVTAIPEPATLVIFAIGGLSLLQMRRRKAVAY